MKKTRSTTLRRAWPSSDFSDRASDRMRSRSEKDYRLHKHFPPAFISQASRGYMTSGKQSGSVKASSWQNWYNPIRQTPAICRIRVIKNDLIDHGVRFFFVYQYNSIDF
ncbi:storkhead-box protein 2-like [Pitangus sulphuratus]|nr:storkhead-box protein 2-like [Pitangus sulphuratus]